MINPVCGYPFAIFFLSLLVVVVLGDTVIVIVVETNMKIHLILYEICLLRCSRDIKGICVDNGIDRIRQLLTNVLDGADRLKQLLMNNMNDKDGLEQYFIIGM